MVSLMKVKDLNKYFERLKIGVSMSKMWNTLQSKSEYGSDRSEKGYQLVAMTMAGNIARKLNMNSDLAETLTMCKGAYFPAYGQEGKKVIMEYLQSHNINISESDLAREYIEYDLSQSGNVIAPEFDTMLREVFDENLESRIPEVELAKICNRTISDVKLIERASNINKTDLLYKVSKDVELCSVNSKKPMESEKLKKLISTTSLKQKPMTEKEKNKIFEDLDTFIKFAGENELEGVYEYIGTDEIEL